jgi:hypothetical protein
MGAGATRSRFRPPRTRGVLGLPAEDIRVSENAG